MKTIKNDIGVETLIFAETLEEEAYEQIKKLCHFEAYQNEKIRIMPDAHVGKGCTIGTTMTITQKLTPNLVGVDIGCGMLTIELNDKAIDFARLDDVIRTYIPGGTNVHKDPLRNFNFSDLRCKEHVDLRRAALSIGTLGSGNHFIEVDQSPVTGSLYLIIHSGSRKLGSDTCGYYQDIAIQNTNNISRRKKEIFRKLKSRDRIDAIREELKRIAVPVERDLAYLTGSDFQDYMNDMAIVQQYASLNRRTMSDIILSEMRLKENSRFETIHNYIDFKRKILRKGAVSAEAGEKLLIPVNMRDGSLLCIGKGNPDWNYSAPHGAGRLMSRTKAKERISMETFLRSMKSVFTTSAVQSTIDEAPDAYRSLEEIVSTITDTVVITDRLKAVYNFKAH